MPKSEFIKLFFAATAVTSVGCSGNDGEPRDGESNVPALAKQQLNDPCSQVVPASPLSQAACYTGRLVGSAARATAIANDSQYAAALASEFTYVTPENEMKWGVLQPTDPNTWNFTAADAIVAAAKSNHQLVKGHALIWHQQVPSFVNESLTKSELRELMRKHVRQTIKHFRDDVVAWDVLNEPMLADGSLRPSVFLNVIGPSYISNAFGWAAEFATEESLDLDLYYNDFGIETINPKSDATYDLLSDLLSQGIRIDGIGIQGHIDARSAPTTQQLVDNFQRFANLGLTINLSELDVRVAGVAGTRVEKFALQQQVYQRIAAACAQTAACDSLTVWGVSDAYSWIDSFYGPDDPLLLDDNFNRKPAYRGVVDGLVGVAPDPAGVAPNLATSGSFETDAFAWSALGSSSIERIQSSSNSGRFALLSSARADVGQGPALNLTSVVQPGFEYALSAFVRVVGALGANVEITLSTTCAGQAPTSVVVSSIAASPSGFSALGGGFAIPYCTLTNATLEFDGPPAGVDLILDDVTVRQTAEPLGPELVSNGTFESGTSGWFGFGPVTLSVSSNARTGTASLLTSNRTDTWQGPATSLTSLVTLGATYRFNGFVRLSGASAATVRMTVKTRCDGVESYTDVAVANADDAGWTGLSGSYQVPLCNSLSELTLYFQGPSAGVALLIDDVSVAQRLAVPLLQPPEANNIVANGTFESGTSGWYSWAGTVGVSTTVVHSGAQSLVVTGSGVGPAATNLRTVVTPGQSYNVSFWVNLGGADSATVHVTRSMNCGSGTTYDWVTNNPIVPAGTWTRLTGAFSVPASCSLAELQLYVEGGNLVNSSGTVSLYVDDVIVSPN